MNKKFYLLISLVIAICSINGLSAKTPPLTRLQDLGSNPNISFEVRSQDLEAARSKAKVDPMALGRVSGIRRIVNFSSDLNKPNFSIATFKVLPDGSEEWVATTSHRYNLRKNTARFRVPLVGLSEPNSKYRFYILTDTGATFAGPFEGSFTLSDKAISSSIPEDNSFPDSVPTGFTKTQMDSIAQYILQRLILVPQSSHRDVTSAIQATRSSNNYVITLPTASTPVQIYEKAVLRNSSDDGSSAGGDSGIVAKGPFNPNTAYAANDIVTNDSSSFIAKDIVPVGKPAPTRANITDPLISQYWSLLVAPQAPITNIVNNTSTVAAFTANGNYNPNIGYSKGSVVRLSNSTFLAQRDVVAGTLPNPNDPNNAWFPLSISDSGLAEENVILPNGNAVQTASFSVITPNSSLTPASVVTLASSTNNVPVTLRFALVSGQPTLMSYETQGITTTFGTTSSPPLPVSAATAISVVGQDYAFFIANNKINLINQPLFGSFTNKTIHIEYRAF